MHLCGTLYVPVLPLPAALAAAEAPPPARPEPARCKTEASMARRFERS